MKLENKLEENNEIAAAKPAWKPLKELLYVGSLVGAGALDYYLTSKGLVNPMDEGNPIMRGWINAYGIEGIIYGKALFYSSIILGVTAAKLDTKTKPKYVERILDVIIPASAIGTSIACSSWLLYL